MWLFGKWENGSSPRKAMGHVSVSLHIWSPSKFITLLTDMQLYEFFKTHFPEEYMVHF